VKSKSVINPYQFTFSLRYFSKGLHRRRAYLIRYENVDEKDAGIEGGDSRSSGFGDIEILILKYPLLRALLV